MAEGTRKNPLEYQREYNEFMHKLKRYLASKEWVNVDQQLKFHA